MSANSSHESRVDDAAATDAAVTAAVIERGPGGGAYAMFASVTFRAGGGGAFFAGPVLFERGEEFTVRLSSPAAILQLRARVVEIEGAPDGPPGVVVEFVGLSDEDRRTIETELAARSG
jgi:hypothetical protein